jgi:DNA-binding transcriptional ArsR family regulator
MPLTFSKNYPLTQDLTKKARLLQLAGDPTRLRILCLMFEHKNTCVSDIAGNLKMSVAAVSHHLQVMRDNGLLSSQRKGNNICYALVKSQLTDDLKKLICH